ncbi:MAG: virulence protein RhuM/Fic/DOC family protein, partial [Caedimonadaceae bacterium]
AEGETVWLNLNQLSSLFERDKSVISRHLKKIYSDLELDRNSTVAFFATVQEEGTDSNKRKIKRQIEYFNLDAILSVGYRVNSKRGIEFRRWTSKILKNYLLKGYSLNEETLQKKGLKDIERTLALLKQSLLTHEHITEIGKAAVEIIHAYSRSWLLLHAYDEGKLFAPHQKENNDIKITTSSLRQSINELKQALLQKKEATYLFGIERENAFEQIIGSIHQTYAGNLLYHSVYERAAHLFYFTIKDHPFTDGNKRIASFLLLLYLTAYGITPDDLTNEALVALALLVAQSQPSDKDVIVKLILNLLVKD